jgi:copper chaperone CopZ
METIQLNILNVKCSGCADSVKHVLAQIPGITEVHVSVPEASVEISTEGSVDMNRIEEALRRAGYPIAG